MSMPPLNASLFSKSLTFSSSMIFKFLVCQAPCLIFNGGSVYCIDIALGVLSAVRYSPSIIIIIICQASKENGAG